MHYSFYLYTTLSQRLWVHNSKILESKRFFPSPPQEILCPLLVVLERKESSQRLFIPWLENGDRVTIHPMQSNMATDYCCRTLFGSAVGDGWGNRFLTDHNSLENLGISKVYLGLVISFKHSQKSQIFYFILSHSLRDS